MKIHKQPGMIAITCQDHDFQTYPGARVLVAREAIPALRNILRHASPSEIARQWQYDRGGILALRKGLRIKLPIQVCPVDWSAIHTIRVGQNRRCVTLLITREPIDVQLLDRVQIIIETSLIRQFALFLHHTSTDTALSVLPTHYSQLYRSKRALGVPLQIHRKHVVITDRPPDSVADGILAQLLEVMAGDPTRLPPE